MCPSITIHILLIISFFCCSFISDVFGFLKEKKQFIRLSKIISDVFFLSLKFFLCPCDILSVWHFVRVTFFPWHFFLVTFYPVTICLCDILSVTFCPSHYVRVAFFPCGILSCGILSVTFCPSDVLSVWHFVRVAFCPWHFVLVTFCPCDILS